MAGCASQSAVVRTPPPSSSPPSLPALAVGHASMMRTVPLVTSAPSPLARLCGRTRRALPPTTTVSDSTNHLRQEVSVGRGNCEAAAAGIGSWQPQLHGTWLQAPPHRDQTLGRALTTPAEAGSPTIPRPKSTRIEQGQRHVGTVGCQGERDWTSSAQPCRRPPAQPPPPVGLHASPRSWCALRLEVAYASIVHTMPSSTAPSPSLACRWVPEGRERLPTTTVSVTANRPNEGASAGRRDCEAAIDASGPR